MEHDQAPPAITEDRLYRGTLSLFQPARGHRAGTDAVLLAAAAPPDRKMVLDLGASTGVVGLRVAMTHPDAHVVLLEREADMAALARRNIRANGLEARVTCHEADVASLGRDPEWRERFDLVLTNPPYFAPGTGRESPVRQKRQAHQLDGDLDGWIRKAASALQAKGRLVMIHRADAIGMILPAMAKRFGALRLLFVQPRADLPANRMLVSGIKGSRQGLAVLPPLVLAAGDTFTPEAAALHDGLAGLDMETGGLRRPS